MTQTVTNISAYVSILSSLIMGRGGRVGGGGLLAAATAVAAGQRAWFVTRCWNLSRSHSSFGSAPPLHPPPPPSRSAPLSHPLLP